MRVWDLFRTLCQSPVKLAFPWTTIASSLVRKDVKFRPWWRSMTSASLSHHLRREVTSSRCLEPQPMWIELSGPFVIEWKNWMLRRKRGSVLFSRYLVAKHLLFERKIWTRITNDFPLSLQIFILSWIFVYKLLNEHLVLFPEVI